MVADPRASLRGTGIAPERRAVHHLVAVPVAMMKVFAPEKTIQKGQTIIMPANVIDFK